MTLTRLVFQRALGAVYLLAFLAAAFQFKALLGARGLLPAADYIRFVPFSRSPSLFYLCSKDSFFVGAAWVGALLSLAVVLGLPERGGWWLCGGTWLALWLLYMSFVNVGQIWYAFGWESILLEAGFYAIFLGGGTSGVPKVSIWLLRWLLFRVMFGAGLIKLRGDPCWRDLTCLDYHYETQPMPNPLSWHFHFAPHWVHAGGVLVNHFCELVVPFGYFLWGGVAAAAGAATMAFQALIMVGGNLSWLNLLTIVLAIPCFDYGRAAMPAPPVLRALAGLAAAVTVLLSVGPARNMLSPYQTMNASYNPLHLVGTYGAFGGITRRRYEIVIEGSDDFPSPAARWRAYEFKGKPGDPERLPPQIAPYHLRLDWLMWFAAMAPNFEAYGEPWFPRLMRKLLEGDADALGLLRSNPFPDHPPRYVRAELYLYRFSRKGPWWEREPAGMFFPPASL